MKPLFKPEWSLARREKKLASKTSYLSWPITVAIAKEDGLLVSYRVGNRKDKVRTLISIVAPFDVRGLTGASPWSRAPLSIDSDRVYDMAEFFFLLNSEHRPWPNT